LSFTVTHLSSLYQHDLYCSSKGSFKHGHHQWLPWPSTACWQGGTQRFLFAKRWGWKCVDGCKYSLQRTEERPREGYKLDARRNPQHLTQTCCQAVLHSSSKPQGALPSPFLHPFPICILGWLTVIRSLESALSLW